MYDEKGRSTGRVTEDGRRYDSKGRYEGRTDPRTGRQYDEKGRLTGRVGQ